MKEKDMTESNVATVPEDAVQALSETQAFALAIERAARDPKVDVEKMERLFALRERMFDRQAEQDFNEAVKFLTMAIDRFRNEKAHTVDGNIAEPGRVVEYLAMSSLTMRLLDRAVRQPV